MCATLLGGCVRIEKLAAVEISTVALAYGCRPWSIDRLSRTGHLKMAEGGVAQAQLRAIVERIERLEEEIKAIGDDIKEVYAEAKGNGFDTKVLRQVIRLRKQDRAERLEQEAILDLYMHALGMAPAAPTGGEE